MLDAAGRTLLIVDGRYVGAARQLVEAGDLGRVLVQPVTGQYDLTLAEALGPVAGGRVGFEAEEVTVAGWQRWQAAVPAVAWAPVEGVVTSRRTIKDEGEIVALRGAAAALSAIARHLGRWIREGRTEREVARAIDEAMTRPVLGARVPDHRGVRTEQRASARAADRSAPASGDLVVLDFGGC